MPTSRHMVSCSDLTLRPGRGRPPRWLLRALRYHLQTLLICNYGAVDYPVSTLKLYPHNTSVIVGPINLVLELVDKLLVTRQHIRAVLNETAERPEP